MTKETCPCGRMLQNSSIAEATGLCDHCREETVIERTHIAQQNFNRIRNEKGPL